MCLTDAATPSVRQWFQQINMGLTALSIESCLHLHDHSCTCRNFWKGNPSQSPNGCLYRFSAVGVLHHFVGKRTSCHLVARKQQQAGNQGTRELSDWGPIHQRNASQGYCVCHDAWQILPWKPSMQTHCRAKFAQAILPLQDLFGLIHGLCAFLKAQPYLLAIVSFHSTGKEILVSV